MNYEGKQSEQIVIIIIIVILGLYGSKLTQNIITSTMQ